MTDESEGSKPEVDPLGGSDTEVGTDEVVISMATGDDCEETVVAVGDGIAAVSE